MSQLLNNMCVFVVVACIILRAVSNVLTVPYTVARYGIVTKIAETAVMMQCSSSHCKLYNIMLTFDIEDIYGGWRIKFSMSLYEAIMKLPIQLMLDLFFVLCALWIRCALRV